MLLGMKEELVHQKNNKNMKKVSLLIVLLCCMALGGCNQTEIILKKEGVLQVNVRKDIKGEDSCSFYKEIIDKKWIDEFMHRAYRGKYDPGMHYWGRYKVHVIYPDTTVFLVIEKNHIRTEHKAGAFESEYELSDFLKNSLCD